MLLSLIRFFLDNKLIAVLLLVVLTVWGLVTVPFNWNLPLPSSPVAVDAIPDIGENQQIVFTPWAGRSPQDIDDQITYPLSTALMGIPGVRTIRSTSMFGFSSIYVIFEEDVEFYWSRSRILEKLNSLPAGLLPEGVQPALGPDATALGQIYWYTLEGRDPQGNPVGGWDPHELRSIQDFLVKYALSAAGGVAEVASIGGYVQEYQIDVDPDALQRYGIGLEDVVRAVRESNLDVGARTIEMNRVEYIVRGLGLVESIEDLQEAVIDVRRNTPVRVGDVAMVQLGPAQRRGMLDKTGAEAVGGVVVARYGSNPMQVIENLKAKIDEIAPGLPVKTLADGTESRVTIVPFYDRSTLIRETLGTLQEALTLQILITIIVIIAMVMHLRASMLISAMLPAAVLMVFIAMRYAGVDANIVALSGIAIAIGTMVDMGIILTENILRHFRESGSGESAREVVFRATREVSGAILTAGSTTIISFLPVFFMEAAEGKLFRPLAFTKTFALVAAILVTLLLLPPLAHWLFTRKLSMDWARRVWNGFLLVAAVLAGSYVSGVAAVVLAIIGLTGLYRSLPGLKSAMPWFTEVRLVRFQNLAVVLAVAWLLGSYWLPLGPGSSQFVNFLFVLLLLGAVLGLFRVFIYLYPRMLGWCLRHKAAFLSIPALLLLFGALSWQGFERSGGGLLARGFDQLGVNIRTTSVFSTLYHTFPGLGKEFMPALDEGSFLLMPTTMPHAGTEEIIDQLRTMDMRVASIPEVETVVGKIGRVESALDPAPLSMFENVILYKPEYITDADGNRLRFRVSRDGTFRRDENGELIPDPRGRYFRQWRDEIRTPDDIWQEIAEAALIPGVTSAPKLQPIETRLVMLQTGMRAPMGVKVSGPDLQTIQSFALQVEEVLKTVPGVKSQAVFADRTVGKPYLEVRWNRSELARYGISITRAQQTLQAAVGGETVTTTVEGRERYPVRVRYARELRDNPEALQAVLVRASGGAQIPLGQLAEIHYVQGPMEIRSEDTFLVSYVLFDRQDDVAELTAVNNARDALNTAIQRGQLPVPDGVSYSFAGTFENQVRAEERLMILIPLVLISIFLMLYLQFRSTATTFMIFTGIAVAWSGGFLMLWLYGQPWFLDFSLFGTSMRELFQIAPVNLSIAVWVGFIALFGIAVDDGVVMATYLDQTAEQRKDTGDGAVSRIHQAVILAGSRRIRPCLMTTATTLLALLPILTSTGRGADIMIPMAIPAFGGMVFQLITLFVVPVLYALREEWQHKRTLNATVSEHA
ncbi:MAG: Cu(I)/Ag(I) efflux system membrane component CusA [Bacteroidetes bacterium HLUCCA01]|nr:MAG: Cu(I)/Ag(I) efflux system membrane component CusA [Bacteroidetes bacterium HLUCCA01]